MFWALSLLGLQLAPCWQPFSVPEPYWRTTALTTGTPLSWHVVCETGKKLLHQLHKVFGTRLRGLMGMAAGVFLTALLIGAYDGPSWEVSSTRVSV